MSGAAQKPDIEIKRKLGVGYYKVYATVYYHPLRIWIKGKWIIGKPKPKGGQQR